MSILFDTIIFVFLAADVFVIVLLWRRREKRRVLIAACVFAWLVIFYGSFIEPRLLVVTEQLIVLQRSAGSAEGRALRVALVGDFHVGPYKKAGDVAKVVRKIAALKPDLVLIAGDSISQHERFASELAPLKFLSAPLGVFAVLGNHDYTETKVLNQPENVARAEAVIKALSSFGVHVLVNEGVALEKSGIKFVLLGTDDIWTDRADIEAARKTVVRAAAATENLPEILLTHNPDIVHSAKKAGIDLVLAAHTHGGQIRLPFIGSVPEIPTELGRHADRGLFDFDGTQLFITSGLGETGPRARLLVPPEIALLEIEL